MLQLLLPLFMCWTLTTILECGQYTSSYCPMLPSELRILQRYTPSFFSHSFLSLQLLQVGEEFGSFFLGLCCLSFVVFEVFCTNLFGLDFGGVGGL